MSSSSSTSPNALHEKNFVLFSIGSFLSLVGRQMLTVAVGWEIYERTHSSLFLGFIGLAQLLPVLLLTLPVGHWVDHHDRKRLLMGAQLINTVATLGLLLLSVFHGPIWGMYLCLLLAGVGRSFHSPSNAALLPQLVKDENFTSAVTWGTIFFQAAAILGPASGGLLLALYKSAQPVYLVDCLSSLLFWLMLFAVKHRPTQVTPKAMTLKLMLSGLKFVVSTRLILAAITLDLFAVLFGGATALLPVYAKDILKVGPTGLGWLQMAPSVGAILMGFLLARNPNFPHAGRWLLLSVAGFGVATIAFGLSNNFALSWSLLFLTGLFDNVSVVIRQALVQLRTPDEMRGRVSAINYVFIGTSNELGGFESSMVAHLTNPVFSVVFGGAATVLTVLGIAIAWPELRRLNRLVEPKETDPIAEPGAELSEPVSPRC